MGFSLCVFFSNSCLKGLRNLEVSQYLNSFVSDDTLLFSYSQGSAFLPAAAEFFWSSLTLEDASSNSKPCDMSSQTSSSASRECDLLFFEHTQSNVFGSWILLKMS